MLNICERARDSQCLPDNTSSQKPTLMTISFQNKDYREHYDRSLVALIGFNDNQHNRFLLYINTYRDTNEKKERKN